MVKTPLRKANNFLILLLVVVLMLSVFLIQNLNKTTQNRTSNRPTPVQSTPTQIPIEIQVNVNPGMPIKSPFNLIGKIDNSWLFESQFNIKLLDSSRKVLFEGPVAINSDQQWTEPGLKDFSKEITFKTNGTKGELIILSDNPSDLPENQKTHIIPVTFSLKSK